MGKGAAMKMACTVVGGGKGNEGVAAANVNQVKGRHRLRQYAYVKKNNMNFSAVAECRRQSS